MLYSRFFACVCSLGCFCFGVQLLYNILLASAVQWSELAFLLDTAPATRIPPAWAATEPQLSSCAIRSYLLLTVVCICQLQSPSSSHPLAQCSCVHSLHLHFYSCPENRFTGAIWGTPLDWLFFTPRITGKIPRMEVVAGVGSGLRVPS